MPRSAVVSGHAFSMLTAQAFSSAVPDLGSRALMVSTLVGNAMLKAFPTVEREISLQAVARASRAG